MTSRQYANAADEEARNRREIRQTEAIETIARILEVIEGHLQSISASLAERPEADS